MNLRTIFLLTAFLFSGSISLAGDFRHEVIKLTCTIDQSDANHQIVTVTAPEVKYSVKVNFGKYADRAYKAYERCQDEQSKWCLQTTQYVSFPLTALNGVDLYLCDVADYEQPVNFIGFFGRVATIKYAVNELSYSIETAGAVPSTSKPVDPISVGVMP